MIKNNYRLLLSISLLLLICVGFLLAGTTGKISGRIVDKQTGEPIPGANVIIPGTFLGAATDLDGYYTILRVSPGLHIVEASMVGYKKITITDVRVQIDQTATVNFEFESEIMAGEEIVIVAERDRIKDDVATSVSAITPQEINALPMTDITSVISLEAGIEDGLVIRGADPNQSLFQIDGITMRDPRNNKPITSIAISGIQEVSVERGGFNAEYGQVRAGIVNTVTKDGSKDKYYLNLIGRHSPPTPKHFGISVYDPNSMWNRPYLDPDVCWVGTRNGAWDEYTQRQYPDFVGWNEISKKTLEDGDPNNDLSPAAAQEVWKWERRRQPVTDEPDYNIDMGFGGPVPLIGEQLGDLRFFATYKKEREMLLIPLSRDDYVDQFFSLKFNSDINSKMRLMVSGMYGLINTVAVNEADKQFTGPGWGISAAAVPWSPTEFLRYPFDIARITAETRPGRIYGDGWYSVSEIGHYVFAAKLSHTLSSSTYYDAQIEHVYRDYNTGPIRIRDYAENYEVVPGYYVDEAPFGFSPAMDGGITGMFFGGHTSTARDKSKISSTTFKVDLNSQFNRENLLKAGVEFVYYNLGFDFGYVHEGLNDISYTKTSKFPYRGALYVQDKFEALGFILNAGVRLDFTNSNTKWIEPEDIYDKNFYSVNYDPEGEYRIIDSKFDYSLSPRLGISHPITEKSKLFFNYGHFKQMPVYEELLRISRTGSGQIANIGDPNLLQAKTVAYELGYDHVIAENFLLQLAAYYRDISGQQSYTSILNQRGDVSYRKANNNSYEDVRGAEITIRRNTGRWVRGFVNYTYQVGTSGFFGLNQIYEDRSEQNLYNRQTGNQYQRKPTPQPYARLVLTFFTPSDFGPEVGSINIFSDISLNVLGDYKAGEHLTYNPLSAPGIQNNVEVTDYYKLDFRFSKTFDFDKIKAAFFVDLYNALDLKRLSGASFYSIHDQNYYLESLHLPASPAYKNIPGDDRIGDYRATGVVFQPIEQLGMIDPAQMKAGVIYYSAGNYFELDDTGLNAVQVNHNKMQKILDDKAYIDMPNNTSFSFLDPRQIFFGIKLTFDF
ncbi:MAG: TonB-dependent receptor [Calditrichaceae bacterium]|nr:TonB-dependent receptor [Calditrichaceae bacterium]MBN2708938.1 TonB-dependent receptor [Calditrichaceae bacterium]RQV97539.1 MAG: TonB-dependent receptor [Calditrichota bacterium]